MAYTYNDFTTAATTAGMLDKFSAEDLTTAQKNPEYGISMLGLMKDEQTATSAEAKLLAQEAMNQLRQSYGSSFTGTYAGDIKTGIQELGSMGSFEHKDSQAYQELLGKVTNPEPFSYDHTTDPQFSALKKSYLREGDRATQNALVQASAATGGVPSSAAVTAAAQAGHNYAGKLNDVIPTLHENAYNRYLQQQNLNANALAALQAERDFDYNKWLADYNQKQNQLGNLMTQDQLEYERYLAGLDQKQQAFVNALNLYNELGYMTPEIEAALGLNTGTGAVTGGSSSGGSMPGRYTGGTVDNGTLTRSQVEQLQNALNKLGAGLVVDGLYGDASKAAAKGLSAKEAYDKYVVGQQATGSLSQEQLSAMQEFSKMNGPADERTWWEWADSFFKIKGFDESEREQIYKAYGLIG